MSNLQKLLRIAQGEGRVELMEMGVTEEELIWLNELKKSGVKMSGADYMPAPAALRFKRAWEQSCRRINPKAWEGR